LVSLFRESSKSRGGRYTCVDGALVLNSVVRLILEIEEVGANGFLPARLIGKLGTAALSRYLIAGGRTPPVPFAERVKFVHVVNAAGLKPGSRKPEQYANLERDIQQQFMPLGSIADYCLIVGDAEAFAGAAGDELRAAVRSAFGA
jgi:hypothetical protein